MHRRGEGEDRTKAEGNGRAHELIESLTRQCQPGVAVQKR